MQFGYLRCTIKPLSRGAVKFSWTWTCYKISNSQLLKQKKDSPFGPLFTACGMPSQAMLGNLSCQHWCPGRPFLGACCGNPPMQVMWPVMRAQQQMCLAWVPSQSSIDIAVQAQSKGSHGLIALAGPQDSPDVKIQYLGDPSCYKNIR